MASRLPAGSAGPSDRTSGWLTQAAASKSVAGARGLAVNGRTGSDVGLLHAGVSTRQPRVAAQPRLANGSMSHAAGRLAAFSSRRATDIVALTQHVAVDVAGFLSAVVCNCPDGDSIPNFSRESPPALARPWVLFELFRRQYASVSVLLSPRSRVRKRHLLCRALSTSAQPEAPLPDQNLQPARPFRCYRQMLPQQDLVSSNEV